MDDEEDDQILYDFAAQQEQAVSDDVDNNEYDNDYAFVAEQERSENRQRNDAFDGL